MLRPNLPPLLQAKQHRPRRCQAVEHTTGRQFRQQAQRLWNRSLAPQQGRRRRRNGSQGDAGVHRSGVLLNGEADFEVRCVFVRGDSAAVVDWEAGGRVTDGGSLRAERGEFGRGSGSFGRGMATPASGGAG
ncbi:hypothetical protein LINGRAPRIM_LOCUS1831 [Linum grandiflorum]